MTERKVSGGKISTRVSIDGFDYGVLIGICYCHFCIRNNRATCISDRSRNGCGYVLGNSHACKYEETTKKHCNNSFQLHFASKEVTSVRSAAGDFFLEEKRFVKTFRQLFRDGEY